MHAKMPPFGQNSWMQTVRELLREMSIVEQNYLVDIVKQLQSYRKKIIWWLSVLFN